MEIAPHITHHEFLNWNATAEVKIKYVLATLFVSSSQNLSKIFILVQMCVLVPELMLRHFSEVTIASRLPSAF